MCIVNDRDTNVYTVTHGGCYKVHELERLAL